MKNIRSAIDGGAKVLVHFDRPDKRLLLPALVLALSLLSSSAVFAQGSIFGTVTNSNATVPANGEISFFGYLDNTDEEIRLELSVGAGYDAGNWYDDFQNYLTEAPGNPYDYHFYNTANGEGFVLSKLMPNNSFQQENITLAPVAWPAAVGSLSGRRISSSATVLRWNAVTGQTYHVYRRLATSSGSFFRVDDPTGSLTNHGVSDSFFVDTGVDGVSDYQYLIIAENGSANLGPHSTVLTVSASPLQAPVATAIIPNNGVDLGGTAVTITGEGFDKAGATATLDGVPLTSIIVVSPFTITGRTPAGTVGPADLVVANTASALSSTPLVGAFTYQSNAAPVLAAIGPKSVAEGANLNFGVSATDADGTTPALSTSTRPANATFTDNGNGTGTFNFNPDFTQAGVYPITFYATDGVATDSEIVTITVTGTNLVPILAPIGAKTVAEAANLNFVVTASDPDGTTPSLSTSPIMLNASFTDNGNGTGTFNFNPSYTQAGVYPVTFYASDGLAIDSEVVSITVTNTNQAPVLAAIGPKSVAEAASLNFGVTATDPDATIPSLSTSILPTNATFVDNGNGTGTFNFTPDYTQAGSYPITFYASDGAALDSEVVTVTVTNTNRPPVLAAIGPKTVAESANLNFGMTATDPDATTPALSTSILPINATFVDNGNGTGTFNFNPDFTQEGSYPVTFYASDGSAVDSEAITITVTHTNQAPVLAAIGPKLVQEGATLNFGITAVDGDGTIPALATSLPLPTNASFVDNGNGTGTFTFNPDFTQSGIYIVTFYAGDGLATDSEIVAITVNDAGNQAPVLAAIGPKSVDENANLNFGVSATDADNNPLTLSAVNLPNGATFIDNLNGTGTCDFTPDYTQSGVYPVTFIVSDGLLADSEVVAITVNNVNRPPVLAAIGPQTITEGGNLIVPVSASDPDGTIPALSIEVLPMNAGFVDNGDGTGTFTFNPSFSQAGIYNVSFYASDGNAADTEIVAVTVTEAGNQPPVLAAIGSKIVYETVTLTFPVTASDPDGTIPSLSALGLPLNATFIDNANGTGSFSFTPDYTQDGSYPVTFKAFDGILVDSEVVTITVLNTNRPPVLNPIGPKTGTEGILLTVTVTATDPDGIIPLLSAAPLPENATFVDNLDGSGTFNFTPDFAQQGVHTVTFYADDGVAIDSEIVTITIGDAGNQPPVLDSIGPKVTTEGVNLTFVVTGSDPDGTTPTLRAVNLPVNATFVDNLNGTGTFGFTPDFTQSGVYGITFIASDGVAADSELVLVAVMELGNQPPVLAPIGPQTVYEGDTLEVALSATDPDGNAIRFNYSTNSSMVGITIIDNLDGTALFRYAPDYSSSGVDTVRIFATDNGMPPMSDVEAVQITTLDLNQPPRFVPAGPFGIKVGKTLTFTVTAFDSTAGSNGKIILGASGVPANATFVDHRNGTGTFTFTPQLNQVGVLVVRFTAVDDGFPPMSAILDIQITVVASNRPPVIADINPQMVVEGQSLAFSISATDPDGGIPALSAEHVPANASFVDNGNGTGGFTFNPSFIQSGLYGIVFRASDGIEVTKVTVLVQVVEAGNQAPILAAIGPQTVIEKVPLTFNISAADPDGSTPVLSADPLPAGAGLTDHHDGTASFSWTPGFSQQGTYEVNFIASDVSRADTEVVVITVIDAGNQRPDIATVADVSVPELGTVYFKVFASDSDGVAPILTTSALPGTATFTDDANFSGRFLWETGYADSGHYQMRFYATDATDPTMVDSTMMTITIVNANRPPIVYIMPPTQTTTVNEGSTINFRIEGSDPDGDPPVLEMNRVIDFFAFTDSGNGVGVAKISPDYMDAGLYAVAFIARDGARGPGGVLLYPNDTAYTETKNFIVNNVPVAPVLDSIRARTVVEGQVLSFAVNGSHPGGLSFQIYAVNLPVNASLSGFAPPRTFTFSPNYTQAGVYNILFYASDGVKADSELVPITVTEAGNQNPYFTTTTFPDTQVIAFRDSVVNRIVATDPDLDPITLSVLNPPANGIFVDSANGRGSIKFKPDSTQVWGMYLFRFIARDPALAADTMLKWVRVVAFLRGDANSNGQVDIGDVTYIVAYVFQHGAPPVIEEAGDANHDAEVNLSDAIFLVNYIFRSGPPPDN
jgi:PKD repeat protein